MTGDKFEVLGGGVDLEFAPGTLLAGAKVKCSLDISIREYVQMQRLWAETSSGDMERVQQAYTMFGDLVLLSWNLQKRGADVPANGEGLIEIPAASANAIFNAWQDAVSGRSPNSSGASASGRTSGAESARTEP